MGRMLTALSVIHPRSTVKGFVAHITLKCLEPRKSKMRKKKERAMYSQGFHDGYRDGYAQAVESLKNAVVLNEAEKKQISKVVDFLELPQHEYLVKYYGDKSASV
jgi:hypothetical protein